MSLNSRIKELEDKIIDLEAKLQDLSRNTEETYKKPITVGGGRSAQGNISAIDIKSGLGAMKGGAVIWNEKEINAPYGTQPSIPKIGYNKHSHSRFSGGALIKDVIEIVEYVWDGITNKHSQGFLTSENFPKIKTEINSKGEQVDKIGLLDLVFNPDTKTWGTPAYEIDIKKCYLRERDETGEIVLDSKGNKKESSLYNSDQTKTALIWDENASCWRFYAVYAPGEA